MELKVSVGDQPRADKWNELVETARKTFTPPPRSDRPMHSFLARITGNAALSTNRWKYAWEEVMLDVDAVFKRSSDLSGTTSTRYALNTIEIGNPAAGVRGNGVNQSGAAYPAGFALKPAGTGSFQLIVMMFETIDRQGQLRYVFSYENADDGLCE